MARLYPPSLSGTLPSFYNQELTIPYVMNKVVSGSDIAGFTLRVKSASTETLLFQISTTIGTAPATAQELLGTIVNATYTTSPQSVSFDLTSAQLNKLRIGQYYKVQLAYIDSTFEIGYFSSIAIIKYTGLPVVQIEGFDADGANLSSPVIVGTYVNEADQSERDYEYRFRLYINNKDTVLDDTGWMTHIAAEDKTDIVNNQIQLEQRDIYTLKHILTIQNTYFIRYSVRTNNDLMVESPYYEMSAPDTIQSTLQANLIAELDYDNACISLKLVPFTNTSIVIVGSFEIGRSSAIENFQIWTIINSFSLNGRLTNDGIIFRDFTIEQGQIYRYAIRQKNANNVYSSWIPIIKWRQIKAGYNSFEEDDLDWNYSSSITAYFEDAFLYDGERQLKIRFNPKIASFKTVLSDSKKTAIGSKYPFFFRNGIVEYKEFTISGLISYLSDQDQFFMSKATELGMDDLWQDSTDITDENLIYERRFKMMVLDWLNQDNIKLFKSPGEGNYLVRLSNVSLTPNDSLSRMIHTFTCTATEIQDFTIDNLIEASFLGIEKSEAEQTLFMTHEFNEYTDANTDFFFGCPGVYIKLEDFSPGSQFQLGGHWFVIGETGNYEVSLDEPTRGLKFDDTTIDDNKGRATIHVGILSQGFTDFDEVYSVSGRKITFYRASYDRTRPNIFEPFYDIKHQISRLYYIKFTCLPLVDIDISIDAIQAYVNKAKENNQPIAIDVDCIYRVPLNHNTIAFLNGQHINIDQFTDYIYVKINRPASGYNYTYQIDNTYSSKVIFGKDRKVRRDQYGVEEYYYVDHIIDCAHKPTLMFKNIEVIPQDENQNPYIVLGNGVVADLGFYQTNITYSVEASNFTRRTVIDSEFNNRKQKYQEAVDAWEGTLGHKYADNAGVLHYITETIDDNQYTARKNTYFTQRASYMALVQAELDAKHADEVNAS